MKTKKGFTLVELLVVIAIIGLLATIAFISLNSARGKARDAKRVSDVRQVMSALELHYNDLNGYPDDNVATTTDNLLSGIQTELQPYIGTIPPTVLPRDGATTVCTDAQNVYRYQSLASTGPDTTCDSTPCALYRITFCLGNTTGGIASGIHTASPNGIN